MINFFQHFIIIFCPQMKLRFAIFMILPSAATISFCTPAIRKKKLISLFIRTLIAFFFQIFHIFFFRELFSNNAGVLWITFHLTFWAALQTYFVFWSNFGSSDRRLLLCAGSSLRTALVEQYLLAQERWYFNFNSGSFSSKGANFMCSVSSHIMSALMIDSILCLSLFWDSGSLLLQFVSLYELKMHSFISLLQNHKYEGCTNSIKPTASFLKHT